MDLSLAAGMPSSDEGLSWQQRLASITGFYDKQEITAFLGGTVQPALEAIAAQMRENGLVPALTQGEERLELQVPHGDRGTFRYTVRARSYRSPSFAWAESRNGPPENRHYRAMASSSEGEQQHDVTGYTSEQLINELLNQYARFRHVRRLA